MLLTCFIQNALSFATSVAYTSTFKTMEILVIIITYD
jgi:hypothetical protein